MRIKLVYLFTLFMFAAGTASAGTYEYEVKDVAYKNLVAHLYLPKTAEKVPVVIAVSGSEGGLHTGDANGQLIAPHGIAVLGLAYFKEQGLPDTLDQIPLEYFTSAIDYLETLPSVDATRIGFVGGSRGAELALLLASLEPRIKSVVATTPSKLAWYGKTTARSAWTFKGKDIPALSLELDEQAPLLSRFEAALKNQENVQHALFAVEKINGPLLLVSAENDQVWPSCQMSKDIVHYLESHGFKYAVRHDVYPTGHGFSQETAPTIKQSIISHFVDTLQ